MKQAQKGDRVKVHYKGTLDDGTVFDSSRERGQPLEFTLGQGRLIKGFEAVVTGLAVGETETVTIPPEEAYGLSNNDLVRKIARDQFPSQIEAKVGAYVSTKHPDGGMLEAVITKVTEDAVTLDANHPLAGKTLTFEIELVDII